MPKPGEILKQGYISEQVVNLLYNTGYRLTGSHQTTQELLTDTYLSLDEDLNLNTVLKNLCLIYRNKAASGWGRNSPQSSTKDLSIHKNSSPIKDSSANKIQAALLMLPHMDRLILVLRDILGLSYTEIAELTGLDKTSVARLLSAGRWEMRKQLTPPPRQGKPPEKYSIAK